MGTKIGWAHHTFKTAQWGAGQRRKRASDANWTLPLRWDAEAARLGIRCRVFCASLADVFDNEVPTAWRVDLLNLIADTPNLDWLLLTKRIGNAKSMLDEYCKSDGNIGESWDAWPNVWIGATICNQAEADRDIPKLLAVPAARRFLSIEPLLGDVDLSQACAGYMQDFSVMGSAYLDWVIAGGESGTNARPMHPDWARSLRDQCVAAGVPYFFKQWGEWEIHSLENGHRDSSMETNGAIWVDKDGEIASPSSTWLKSPYAMIKVGKKAAGRLLDGREWNEVPA